MSMARKYREEEIKKHFEGIKTRGWIRALKEEIKRIKQVELLKIEETWEVKNYREATWEKLLKP